MTNGTISGNKTNGMGGGVATAVLSENDTVGGGRFHMTGGTISDNTASCGGGVYSWSGRDRVVLEGGNIVNNTARRQGGGVYVSHAPWSITIKNALITANKAAIQGGGIWSCPVGTVTLARMRLYLATRQANLLMMRHSCLSGTRRIPPASAARCTAADW